MPEFVNLKVGPAGVDIYIYVDTPNSVAKANELERFFRRLPVDHLRVLYPIVIMDHKPGMYGRGGGTYTPGEVPRYFTSAAHERRTGVPNQDIQDIFTSHGSRGLIAIPKDRWERPIDRLINTIFHEVGHCVHNSFPPRGLIAPGLALPDLNGVDVICGGAGDIMPRVVELYARYICIRGRIAHHVVPGETIIATNRRMIGYLRSSEAFRNVPESWNPV